MLLNHLNRACNERNETEKQYLQSDLIVLFYF